MKRGDKKPKGLSWGAFKDEWRAWWKGKAPVLFFGAKFGGLILLLYVLLSLPVADMALYHYLRVNAWLSNGILNLLGQGTHVTDVTIASSTSPFAIAIRRGCDAVEPTWLLCAAILAFPGPWLRKLIGMGVGIVILQLLNLVRIVTLYLIGARCSHSVFDSMHLEIWPAAFIVVAIALFIGWKGWALDE